MLDNTNYLRLLNLCRSCDQRDGQHCRSGGPCVDHAQREVCPLGRYHSPAVPLPPFQGPVRRHALGHVWPCRANDRLWRWHVRQFAAQAAAYNGRRLVYVAIDRGTATIAEVAEEFGACAVELRPLINNPGLGESPSFQEGLRELSSEISDPQACLFYWHTKGVSIARNDPQHDWYAVRQWAVSMWRTCGLWPLVREQLQRFAVTGSHRQPWPGTDAVHYSGTFFWLRLMALQGRPWHQLDANRYAVERWPGQMFARSETGCLFDDRLDDPTAPGTLYRSDTWRTLAPQLHDFMRAHS